MLGERFRHITVISLVGAYLLTSWRAMWSPWSFAGHFLGIWLLGFASWALWATQLYPKLFSPLRHLPEPSGNSFWHGQFPRISAEPSGVPMLDWIHSVPNEGLIKYKGLFNRERILPVSPKALAEVLVTKNYDFEKPHQMRSTIGRILGVGILLAEGDEHKAQRRNLNPAFAYRHIKELYPIFWAKSRESVQVMTEKIMLDSAKSQSHAAVGDDATREKCDDTTTGSQQYLLPPQTAFMEVGEWASRVTLDIIGVAGLGTDFNAIHDPDGELIRTYQLLFRPSRAAQILGLLNEVLPSWIITRLPVRRNADIHSAARFIRNVCRDLVRSKKEQMSGTAAGTEKPLAVQPDMADKDLLAVALRSGGFSDENLVDQLMTFLAAGHETTATAMTWAIYLLSRFPDVQNRLRDEVRSRLPSPESGETISSADIDGMPYLNAVCSEVLRYYGPVPTTIRETARDTTVLGHFVPKGTRVFIPILAVNKSKELWGPDADQFRPGRWLGGAHDDNDHHDDHDHDQDASADKKRRAAAASGGASSNYAFMTFLHGPRSCIGSGFAKAEFAVLLASWVGRFEFRLRNEEELDETKVVIKGGATARPANGMHVKVTMLDGW